MKQSPRKGWATCPLCHILIFESEASMHRCPTKALAKKDAELDAVIDEELSTWEDDVKKFWNSKDVKFWIWCADQERNE